MISRTTIFKNSWNQYQGGACRLINISDNNLYYKVKDLTSGKEHDISISMDPETKAITTDCTCTNQALKSQHKGLCSHQITALRQATQDIGRPKSTR